MVKRVLCALAACGLALALTACAQGTHGNGKQLRVGVRGDVVNFGYRSQDSGRYTGLEIDLARELAARMGYEKAVLVGVEADERDDALSTGQVDCLAAMYSITPEREALYDFSAPYYEDTIQVVVEDSSEIASLRQLKGLIVGVRRDTTAALELCRELVRRNLIPAFDEADFAPETFDGGLRFACYDSYEALSEALEVGRVDAMCLDGSIAKGAMSNSRGFVEQGFAPQSYGVATPKGSALTAQVAQAVEAMRSDGTLERLTQKWD